MSLALRERTAMTLAGLGAAAELASQGRLAAYLKRQAGSTRMARINLFLCLRAISRQEVRGLARRASFYRVMNEVDFHRMKERPYTMKGADEIERALAAGYGAIVCTQHLGPYRRIGAQIARLGVPVTMLVNEQTRFSSDLARSSDDFQGVRPLNVEQPGAMSEAVKCLKRNELLLVYLDGNTGTQRPGEGEVAPAVANTVEIRFFGRTLRVRRGVCQMAFLGHAPLVPAFAMWGPGLERRLEIAPPLTPTEGESLADFSERGMQTLYRLSEEAIGQRPEQYEEWPRVHRWIVAGGAEPRGEAPQSSSPLDDVLVVPLRGGTLVAERRSGRVFAANPPLEALVHEVQGGRTVEEATRRIGRQYGQELVEKALAQLQMLGLVEPAVSWTT